ncbi:histidine kinase [Bosea sp. (in: a-proteobacteria)]|uniref:histidine kinase n=1 Tax=Bosea sp. (in: a-proteobacteria) TaxID=1871050 RepID=UPI003F7137CF
MADFYPILARAIAGLPDKSPEARRAVYDRAKAALVAQLRSLDPPVGEAEIMRERLALDEAVARVEVDYEGGEAERPATTTIRPAPESAAAPLAPAPGPLPPAETLRDETDPERPRFDDEPGELPEPVDTQPVRPRVAPPRERRVDPGHIRTAIVGGGVAIAVAAIAGAAYYVNKIKPPEVAQRPRVETSAQPAQPDAAGKLGDRIGEGGATAPVQQPRTNPNTGTPAAQPPAGSEVAVAQRAILYTEVPENPQQPQAVNGRVFWRLDSESAGQGRPVETIVRATIEVPDAGLSLDFTIRRNTDSAFPASHIIGLRFTRTGDATTDAIREVGVPQFKADENERGAPLSAISSALGDNLFVSALSNNPVEIDRNIDLMQNRNWVDIPVRFASGRRGIITFEKGVSGNQTLADALGRWR